MFLIPFEGIEEHVCQSGEHLPVLRGGRVGDGVKLCLRRNKSSVVPRHWPMKTIPRTIGSRCAAPVRQ